MAHVLSQLLWGFHHLTAGHGLFRYYLNHHALAFLRSGQTSGSGGRAYLHWLTFRYGVGRHGISPVDWLALPWLRPRRRESRLITV